MARWLGEKSWEEPFHAQTLHSSDTHENITESSEETNDGEGN